LREREKIPNDRQDGVGVFTTNCSALGPLAQWATARKIDAVIWTALPPRLDVEGLIPSYDDVLGYLKSLSGEKLAHARTYIEQVPQQIDTMYRRAIIKQFGWK
jgi:hypothetical protein